MASDGEKGEYHLLSDTGTDEKSRGERFWESLTGSKPNKSKKSSHTKPLLSLGDSAEQSAADDDDAGAQDEEQVNPPLGRQRSASEASDYIQRYDVEAGDESNYQPGRRTYHRTDWSQRPERVPDEYMHEDSGAVSDTGQRGASSSRSYHRMQERNLTSANHREQTTEEAWSSQFQGTQSQPAYVVPAKQIVRAPVHRGPPLYGVARRTANPLRKPSNIRPAFGRHHKASTGSVTGSYRDPLFNDLTGGGDINYQSAARDNPMRMGRKDKKEDRARVIEERRRRRKEQRKIERLTGTGSDHDSQSLTTEVEEDKKAKSSSKSGKWKKKNRKSSTSGSNKSSTSSSESDSDSSSENETARLSAYCTCGVLSTPELRKELRSSGSHDLLPHSIKNGPPLKWYHTVYTDVLHSKGIPYHQGRHGSQIQAGVHDFSQTLGSRETDKALEKDVEEKKRQVGLDPDDTIQEARDSEENFEQRFHKRGVIPEFKDEEESENSELPWQQIKDTQQPFPESQRNQSNHGIELATDRSLANGVEQTKTSKAVKFNERGEEEIIGKPVEEERFSSPDIFYFTFGVVVFWGFTESQEREFLERIRKFQYQLVKTIEYDDMAYAYGRKSTVSNDEVTLKSDDPLEKLAVSYAFAQSVKLSVCEQRVNDTIEDTKDIPVELARTGKISLSASDISRKIGELFIERNSVNLTSDILDTPEFLWESDEYEPVYEVVQSYLDVDTRVDVLNQRLDIIRELLDMLSDQLENQHASRLEWIIIWLIVIEVVIEAVWNMIIRDIAGKFDRCGCND